MQASLSCTFNMSYFSIKLIQTDHLTQIHLSSVIIIIIFFFFKENGKPVV